MIRRPIAFRDAAFVDRGGLTGVETEEALRLVAAGAEGLGIEVDGGDALRLARFALLVLEHGEKLGLTAAKTVPEVVNGHVIDSLALLRFMELGQADILADVGSGAGFPGMALKIARPWAKAYLIESKGRRVGFLEHAASCLGIGGVEVICGRVEEVSRAGLPGKASVVTARAVGGAPALIAMAGPLVSDGGALAMWKGPGFQGAEAAEARRAAAAAGFPGWFVGRYQLPGRLGKRLLVICRKGF